MYEDLNAKLKEAAVYSNEIIKLAKGHDPKTFEFAKGGRKYFAIFGESFADSYMTTIESYRLLEATYRRLDDYGEIINIYKKMEEKVIPELYGNLFKKMIEKLRTQSATQPTKQAQPKTNSTYSKPSTPSQSSTRVSSSASATRVNPSYNGTTARVYQREDRDRGTATVANPYLNGGRKY